MVADSRERLERVADVRRSVYSAYAVLVGFFLVFLLWAGATPLTSAAIAQGTLGVEGQRKSIQHVQGGVVEHIHVRDGDRVARGDVLIELGAVSLDTEHDELDQRAVDLAAELSRWNAERAGRMRVVKPPELEEHVQASLVKRSVATQQEILDARLAVHNEASSRLAQRKTQSVEDAAAYEQRLSRLQEKRRLIDDELAEQRALEDQGLIVRSDVFDLEKDRADLLLDVEEAEANLARLRQESRTLTIEMAELVGKRRQEIVEQINRVRGELQAVRQQLRNAQHQRSNLVLRAPVGGFVMNLAVHTVGGVAGAGQVLMEIVPAGQRLLVECQVPARDRESVRIGQTAEVRLSAFDKRSTRPLPGRVRTISADSTADPLSGNRFYTTIVEIDVDEIEGSPLHPGMQADVLISTGTQTLLGYLTAPLTRSFNRALRES